MFTSSMVFLAAVLSVILAVDFQWTMGFLTLVLSLASGHYSLFLFLFPCLLSLLAYELRKSGRSKLAVVLATCSIFSSAYGLFKLHWPQVKRAVAAPQKPLRLSEDPRVVGYLSRQDFPGRVNCFRLTAEDVVEMAVHKPPTIAGADWVNEIYTWRVGSSPERTEVLNENGCKRIVDYSLLRDWTSKNRTPEFENKILTPLSIPTDRNYPYIAPFRDGLIVRGKKRGSEFYSQLWIVPRNSDLGPDDFVFDGQIGEIAPIYNGCTMVFEYSSGPTPNRLEEDLVVYRLCQD